MIDQELELSYGVQATDLRICEVDDPYASASGGDESSEQLFNASWDSNDTSTLLLAHSAGTLRIFHTIAGESSYFKLMFQPHGSEARMMKTHWDKLTTIPKRPGHLLFVLGVSRQVLHATLPTHTDIFARNDFVFGEISNSLGLHLLDIVMLHRQRGVAGLVTYRSCHIFSGVPGWKHSLLWR
jgi:hypothetical protein